mmetsp:Transcript_43546/g.44064  ORF Transcript_43546/g.44064 Transcript_43546/m.44064 type:complete len:96 (+) Transcript_43546:63-350(+)
MIDSGVITGTKEKNWVHVIGGCGSDSGNGYTLVRGEGEPQPRIPYGYCNLACRQTCCMVFLEVVDVTKIESPGPNENAMVAVVDRNEGDRNGVGD